jgi:hypothetical protein
MSGAPKPYKIRRRPARCKQVLVILNGRIETLELIREEVHPAVGDFAEGPLEFAVVRWLGLEVSVPLECVMFLGALPPEPEWIQKARTKMEKELASTIRSSGKRVMGAEGHDRPGRRVVRRRKR